MFKNFRNKVAVLALVALGLAFGHAWSSQAEKTNGELIYEAIIKGELPDETSGMWEITHEVAQEEKEQKEEQEHEVAQEEKEQNGEQEQEGKEPKDADSRTSNWTIRSNGTSPTETTLTAEIMSNIKTAIERLLKNDDVVTHITIHNIASGHMYEGARGFGEIDVAGTPKFEVVCAGHIQLLKSLAAAHLSAEDVTDALLCAFDHDEKFHTAMFVGALRHTTNRTEDFSSMVGITAKMSKDIAPLFLSALYKKEQINMRLYDIKELDLKYYHIGISEADKKAEIYESESKDYYPIMMYMAYYFIQSKGTSFFGRLIDATKTGIKDFLNNAQLTVNACDTAKNGNSQLSLSLSNDKKYYKLILDIHRTKKCVYITHFGPAN